jgi:ABC-type transport system involved in multi-copper enzyme maturation permease subunit
MLRELIAKDLRLTRRRLLLNVGVFAVFLTVLASTGDLPPGLLAGAAALMFSFVPVTVVAQEDRNRAAAVACSLPVRRRDVVGARYLLGLGAGAAGLLLAVVLALALPGSPHTAASVLAPGTLLAATATLVVSLAVFLPFTIRFGLIGILGALAALQVLGMAGLALANRFGGAGPRALVRGLVAGVTSTHAALGDALFAGVALAVLAALLLLSVRLATRLFEQKEL